MHRRSQTHRLAAIALTLGLASLLVVTLSTPATAPTYAVNAVVGGCPGTYLEVPGIPGSSEQQGHEGEIDVESYQYEGKKLVVTKRLDRASPKLAKAAAEQKNVGDIVLTFSCGPTSMKLTFKDATVTGYMQQKGAQDELPIETVTFTFKKVEMEVSVGSVEESETFDAKPLKDLAPCGCDKSVVPTPCPTTTVIPIPNEF